MSVECPSCGARWYSLIDMADNLCACDDHVGVFVSDLIGPVVVAAPGILASYDVGPTAVVTTTTEDCWHGRPET